MAGWGRIQFPRYQNVAATVPGTQEIWTGLAQNVDWNASVKLPALIACIIYESTSGGPCSARAQLAEPSTQYSAPSRSAGESPRDAAQHRRRERGDRAEYTELRPGSMRPAQLDSSKLSQPQRDPEAELRTGATRHRSDIVLSETLIRRDVRMVVWVNDEQGGGDVQAVMLNVKSDNLFASSTINSHKPFGNTSVKNSSGGTASNHR
ncbi:hypothetical protein V8E52_008079 [Russula decolorans]